MEWGSFIETRGPSTTRAVERVCAVLSAFTPGAEQLTLAELALRTGLPKATVYRLASSLTSTGFLSHRDDGRYTLGLKLSDLGAVARARVDVVEACSPVLDALAIEAGETVLLCSADWDQLELTIVSTRVSRQVLSVTPAVGRRMKIAPGVIGKALLMGLPDDERASVLARLPLEAITERTCTDRAMLAGELRQRRPIGYVKDEGEFVDGVSGVAVPVLFDRDRPRAAIGVVGPTFRVGGELERLGRLLLEASSALRPAAAMTSHESEQGVDPA